MKSSRVRLVACLAAKSRQKISAETIRPTARQDLAGKTAASAPMTARLAGLGRLPEWNFDDLYSGLDDPAIKRDLDRADADCVAFEEAYKGKLAEMAARAAWRRGAGRGGAAL